MIFPFLIDHPDRHFPLLKRLGVPIWRWDELAVSDCQISHYFRLHLLHLPCHQGLSDNEMNWLIAAVRAVMHVGESATGR